MKIKRFLSVIVLTAFVLSCGAVLPASAGAAEGVSQALKFIDGITEIVSRAIASAFEFRNNYAEYDEICEIPETENGYVPQGFCVTENGSQYAVSYYHADNASVISFVDAESGKRLKTLNLLKANGDNFTGHAGGIAQDCGYFYIGNGSKIYRIPMSDIEAAADGGSICLSESITADVKCSFINSDGEYLYAGEFYTFAFDGGYDTDSSHYTSISVSERSYARCAAYSLSELNESFDNGEKNAPSPEYMIALPNRVQGFARGENGEFILSTSYGRNNDSFMLVYGDVTDGECDVYTKIGEKNVPVYCLKKSDKTETLRQPPMLEGIDTNGGEVYGIFESGAEKYSDAAVVVNSICKF